MEPRVQLTSSAIDSEKHGATKGNESDYKKNNREPMLVATEDPDTTDEETLHNEYHHSIRNGLEDVESSAIDASRFGRRTSA